MPRSLRTERYTEGNCARRLDLAVSYREQVMRRAKPGHGKRAGEKGARPTVTLLEPCTDRCPGQHGHTCSSPSEAESPVLFNHEIQCSV